jgi:hypothetical protein
MTFYDGGELIVPGPTYRNSHLANLLSSRTKHPKIRVRRRIFSQTA